MRRTFFYQSASGNIYPWLVGTGVIRTSEVVADYQECSKYCKLGCKLFGKGGGCPPLSPKFSDLRENYPLMWVCFVMFEQRHIPPRLRDEPRIWYRKVRFQDILLSKFLYSVMEAVKKEAMELPEVQTTRFTPCGKCTGGVCYARKGRVTCGGGVMHISNGHCEGCRGPVRCNFKMGLDYCRYPDRRVFSLEATGVRVDSLMSRFGIETHWYTRENHLEVPYMVKTAALLIPTETTKVTKPPVIWNKLDDILRDILKEHKHRVQLDEEQRKIARAGGYIHDVKKP